MYGIITEYNITKYRVTRIRFSTKPELAIRPTDLYSFVYAPNLFENVCLFLSNI